MSLYAIKDEDGELRDRAGETPEETNDFYTYTDHAVAEFVQAANYPGGRVVELVEKAEPAEESKEVGELLADLREELAIGYTADSAYHYVDKLKLDYNMSIEDIFRALDVGWTVKQPKRHYIKAPKEWAGDEKTSWFYKDLDGAINTVRDSSRSRTSDEQFTADEIDKYHLGGFEKVEVED
ncbi:DUF1642 domain-containing protein [Lacticaseibacillus pantheris]|uniref:DUF1642 domain-containing protein n=1 Tax=Lacticaseibacillus pantheris TaxID=171523 RepID=UPI002659EBE0|nr:DUF1642 domain-containing protein [Lacticaseibacillus pantheris]WKF84471.1 DUF1642 domain-containing protein [Lacticaseibacillus pantheris]